MESIKAVLLRPGTTTFGEESMVTISFAVKVLAFSLWLGWQIASHVRIRNRRSIVTNQVAKLLFEQSNRVMTNTE